MSFKRLLVPVELGDASDIAVETACALARALEAEMVLLHVYDVAHGGLATGIVTYPGRVNRETADDIVAHIRARMDERVKQVEAHGAKVAGRIERGIPADAILDAIRAAGADLVVLSRRGAGRGTARRVLAQSPVPVLVINAGAAEKVAMDTSEHDE
jgi:nucleotide-binding universal stress UspA family protein